MRFNALTLTLSLLLITGLVGCGGGASSASGGGGGGGNPTLTSIHVAGPDSLDLANTGQFSATGHYSDSSTKNITSAVTWASSSSSNASVSSSGLATAITAGKTNITATSGSISGAASLQVNGFSKISVAGPASFDPTKTGKYSATGHFKDGNSQDVSGKVTWSSSSTSTASIDNTGLATGIFPGNTKIEATLGSLVGSAALEVNSPVTISLTPIGPALTAGGATQQLTAMGNFKDGFNMDLTSMASWSSSASSVAGVSKTGLVTGTAVGVATITATFGIPGSTAVNVTSQTFSDASLNGSYAFFLTSVDKRGQAVVVGSLKADGVGGIAGGVADVNSANAIAGPLPLTPCNKCYSVWPDGRGEATITFEKQSVHVAFILSDVPQEGTVASKGKMISFDGNKAFGNFELQTAGANLSGVYVFGFNGLDAGNNSEAQIGVFDTAKLTENFDVDDNGSIDGGNSPLPKKPLAFNSVTVSSVSTGNRGTAQLGTAALGAANYAFYTVDGTKAYFIETDTVSGSTALAGVAEQQQVPAPKPLSPETSATVCGTTGFELTCDYAYLLAHTASAQNGVFEKAGQFNFCPCTVAGAFDHDHEDNDADGQTWSIVSGTRPFDGFGRGRLQYKVTNAGTPKGVQRYAIAYTIESTVGTDVPSSSSRFFMMNTEVVTAPASPGVGAVDFINISDNALNVTPAPGTYTFSATAIGDVNLLELGQVVVLDSKGNVTGIHYINNNGVLSAVAVAAGAVFTPNSNSDPRDGRGRIAPFDSNISSMTAYNVGSKGLILVGTFPNNPDVSGRMEMQ
jgi:hypothetical protein